MTSIAKRAGTTAVITAGTILAGSGVASAAYVPPAVPDASEGITTAAGQLSNGAVDTFTDVLPYAVPLLLLAWGYSVAKGMIGARKKKPS